MENPAKLIRSNRKSNMKLILLITPTPTSSFWNFCSCHGFAMVHRWLRFQQIHFYLFATFCVLLQSLLRNCFIIIQVVTNILNGKMKQYYSITETIKVLIIVKKKCLILFLGVSWGKNGQYLKNSGHHFFSCIISWKQ